MDMIRHDHRGLKIDSLAVVMETMRENQIARRVGEGIADELAESHKDRTARLLVMWHAPPIFVFAAEGRSVGHSPLKPRIRVCVSDGRTSRAFGFPCRADTLVRCL